MEPEIFPPSDSQYAEALQFQETLIASVITSQSHMSKNDSVSIESTSTSIPKPHETLVFDPDPKPESGETSQRFCEICAERKEPDEMFKTLSCTHSVCSNCISMHVSIKVRDGTAAASTAVTCPGLGCLVALEPAACRGAVPADVLARWEAVLFEALIAESQKFYCPYRDCSALLVNDGEGGVIMESECPICRRLFCAQCYVPWHAGVGCEEFQRLSENEKGREDLMVRELARGESWNRCPHCKFYLEKTDGCLNITCRQLLFDDEMETEIFPHSDSQYAEALQFQETLIGSIITSQMLNNNSVTIESASISHPKPYSTMVFDPVPFAVKEFGEMSQSLCEICTGRKETNEMFKTQGCTHSVCSDCIAKHVSVKVQNGAAATVVMCPGLGCSAVLVPAACQGAVPPDILARWEVALCEALIVESQKFFCPYRDCSVLLVNDDEGGMIKESECPICRRLFCAQCYVAWHAGVGCEEFQRLSEHERGREDLMVRELARGESWNRCPHCKFYVEKTEGCLHITCRCGFEFCYGCGSKWSSSHGGCERMLSN